MSVRHELRRQSTLASQRRGKGNADRPQRWCGSNVILAMMAAVLAIVCAVEILHG